MEGSPLLRAAGVQFFARLGADDVARVGSFRARSRSVLVHDRFAARAASRAVPMRPRRLACIDEALDAFGDRDNRRPSSGAERREGHGPVELS